MLLETNYRERLHMVTNEVKKRLDYQVALQNLQRRMEQEHMVNWVEQNVIKSITPQQVHGSSLPCLCVYVAMEKCHETFLELCSICHLGSFKKKKCL